MSSLAPLALELLTSFLQRDHLCEAIVQLSLELSHLLIYFINFFVNEFECHTVLALFFDDRLNLSLLGGEADLASLHFLFELMYSLLHLDFIDEV